MPRRLPVVVALLLSCTRTPGSRPDASSPDAGSDRPACESATLPDWASKTGSASWRLAGPVPLAVSVFEPGVVRLRYEPDAAPDRSFAVVARPVADTPVRAGGDAERFALCTSALRIEVTKQGRVRATTADGSPLFDEPEDGGWFRSGGTVGVVRSLAEDEHFYGFGEKTGPLDKRGRVLVFRNTDAYDDAAEGFRPDADPLYQSIPFFTGLRGSTAWGLFTDNPRRQRMDMGSGNSSRWSIAADGGVIDQYVFAGPALADVVRRFTWLVGRMPLPPRWSLGYHQSRWGYEPEEQVREIAANLRARGIPADGMWLDIQHMDDFRSFTWDRRKFPDPAKLLSDLAAQGFKTTLIVDPGLKVDPAWDVYTQGVAQGRFIRRPDGSPYVGRVWPGDAVFPDFTDPATRDWWSNLVAGALSPGVRGIWIDMNEPANFIEEGKTVPDSLAVHGDGHPTTMAEAHNVYALLEAQATREGMLAAAPDRRPFVLTRAGYAGIQRYAAAWTGDAPSTWDSLAVTLPMLLGMGLSGEPFVGSDVGGYSGRATPELFARWMQLGAVSPFFRAHTMQTGARQEPWVFGSEVEDISRAAIRDRYALLPYLYSVFREATQTGAPVLRPLVWDFADDPRTHTLGDQAMLGPSLLVAPVLQAGVASRRVYLPAGRWFEARSGAVREGPTEFEQALTLAALPTFVRAGAIIPSVEPQQWTDRAPATTLRLDVYPSSAESSFTLWEDDGETFAFEKDGHAATTYTLRGGADGARLSAARTGAYRPAERRLVVRVRRADHGAEAVLLDGTPLERVAEESALESGPGWWHDAADLSLVAAFPDRPSFTLDFRYDPALTPAAALDVPFEVRVPADTPTDRPVCIATSANGWTHQPLHWKAPGVAAGTVSVPRGEWFFYKFTRGDWATVEKWPGCTEATNRYGFGAARPLRADSVSQWADRCR